VKIYAISGPLADKNFKLSISCIFILNLTGYATGPPWHEQTGIPNVSFSHELPRARMPRHCYFLICFCATGFVSS
jgi:hypothetical protein